MSAADPVTAAEGQVLTAGELGREHHGWLVTWQPGPVKDSQIPRPFKRTIALIGVRQWTSSGVERVGLLADTDRPFRGVEHHLRADTEVRLDRFLKRGVPRLRKADYPERDAHE